MTHKLEPTSDVHGRMHATSFMGEHLLEIGVAQPPVEAGFVLPERYGVPLFEVLIVDIDYLFISWEISAAQLEAAQRLLGEEAFRNRRLKVRFHDGQKSGSLLLERELYGDVGRWFLRLSHPGKMICADLGYAHGSTFYVLNSAGPLHIPRCTIIEPAAFNSLEVSYGFGMHGRLMLLGTHKHSKTEWPESRLPLPDMAEYATARLPAVRELDEQGLLPGRPSSAEMGIEAGGRPSSGYAVDLAIGTVQRPADKGEPR